MAVVVVTVSPPPMHALNSKGREHPPLIKELCSREAGVSQNMVTVTGSVWQGRVNQAPVFLLENKAGKPQGMRSMKEITAREEQVHQIHKFLSLPLSCTQMDLVSSSEPKVLRLDSRTDHRPGPRLATGHYTQDNELNPSAKALTLK